MTLLKSVLVTQSLQSTHKITTIKIKMIGKMKTMKAIMKVTKTPTKKMKMKMSAMGTIRHKLRNLKMAN